VPASAAVPSNVTQTVLAKLKKASVAELPLQGFALVAGAPIETRLLYTQASLDYAAKHHPTALRSFLVSLTTAYPELATEAVLAAAKASPAQLPTLVSAVAAAAPSQMPDALAALSHTFPESRAAIISAAEKVYPDLKPQIAAAVALGAQSNYQPRGYPPEAKPPIGGNNPPPSEGERPDNYGQSIRKGKGPKDYGRP